IAYETWEAYVRIEETVTNRFADILVGLAGFIPAFFLLAPLLGRNQLVLSFAVILVADIVMSIFGWRASQKAAELQKRMHQRYVMQRELLAKQQKRLKERFRR
ncbi:hypothetical protein K8R03_00005, partial [Candidatus Kaiserbacteria bacterium]|nr:hypothetical protein [Candidatus Kaiserbacteria bacterium]